MSNANEQPTWVLPNGLKVIVVDRKFGKTFAASLMLRVGMHDAPAASPVLPHMAEHLAFVGPNQLLIEELCEHGGFVNGSTSREHTEFEAFGHIELLERALQMLDNVLAPGEVTKDEFQREQDILQRDMTTRCRKHSARERRTFSDMKTYCLAIHCGK